MTRKTRRHIDTIYWLIALTAAGAFAIAVSVADYLNWAAQF